MKKPVMIIENNNNPLSLNEELVNSGGKKSYLLGGIFTEFDIKNRNERIYTAPKFLPCLEELNDRITNMGVYGEFDHPDVFDTSLSRASHLVKEASYNKELNRIEGKIQLLSTFWGKEARSLVEDGCPIFVSSRAAGVTENDGSVSLKKLFTYDIVADPGFSSAKMSSINESLNYSNNTNFRIYEMSDESKINDIFKMNKNDFVTKEQLSSYSDFLIEEISNVKNLVSEAVKSGKMEPSKLEELLEYYDTLNTTNTKMVQYLDYLAEKIQIVANENKNLKAISEKLIAHNDYLAENLEKTIEYSEYIAENLDKNIAYSEYIAENLDKNIAYSEYIAENLDKNIAYSEYIAENLDNTIAYSEYLAEHVENNIEYSEYIAENLDDNIAYSEYIAENLDKGISYIGLITEKLNGNMINEEVSSLPTLEEWGFETEIVEEQPEINDTTESEEIATEPATEPATEINEENEIVDETTEDETTEDEDEVNSDETPEDKMECESSENEPTNEINEENEIPENEISNENEIAEEQPQEIELENTFVGESDSELSNRIDNLIAEAKKRKLVETNDLHFLKFLNKSQVEGYYNLTEDEKELVKEHLNGKSYFNSIDVLKMIQEALSIKNETLDEKLIRLIPENLKDTWNSLNDNSRKSILSQAKLGYDLTNESAIENFWHTRNFKNNTVTKTLVSHDSLIQEDKLSDSELNSILERINRLK